MEADFSIISVLFRIKRDDVCPLTSMKFIPPIANLLAVAIRWASFVFHPTETSK